MNNFLKLPKTEQIKYLNEAVFSLNLPPEAIEKDIWVTAVLRSLFALPYLPVRALAPPNVVSYQ